MYKIYSIKDNAFVDHLYTEEDICHLIWNNSEFHFVPKYKYVKSYALKNFSFGENDLYNVQYDYIYTEDCGGVHIRKDVPKLYRIYDEDNRIVPPHLWKEMMMIYEDHPVYKSCRPSKEYVEIPEHSMPNRKDHRYGLK